MTLINGHFKLNIQVILIYTLSKKQFHLAF